MSSIENIVKRLRESRITESSKGIISISIDEEKLEAAMKKEGYYEGEFSEFLYDVYGLEDGEDFQTGNGFELLFYEDTGKDDKIEKLRKDIGESIEESAENFNRAEMIRIIRDEYKKDYDFDKFTNQQLYKILNRLEDKEEDKIKEKAYRELQKEKESRLDNKCEECGHILTDSGECPNCDLHLDEDILGPSDQWLKRDNSDYHKELRKEEESHPYVGKKVMWKEDRKYYEVDRAYEGRDGVVVRCGNITMKPGEYVIEESSEVKDSKAQEIFAKIKDKVKEYMMTPEMGFPEDEVDEYSRVEIDSGVNDEGDEFIKVEVRAELGYVALSNLCDELNPVLSEYDKDSYFEPEQPGIIVAYLFI